MSDTSVPSTSYTNGIGNVNVNGMIDESHVEMEYKQTDEPTILQEFRDKINKGLPLELSKSSLASILDLIRHRDALDDRKLFLEHAITFISRLPEGPFADTLHNKIIEIFYNDLAHPPQTQVGKGYAWRTADGSFNNIDIPNMGKAGTPYARSVQQSHPLPNSRLPDSGLLFDALLKRDGFVKHPAGLSSLMFSFAALVIHTIFRTSHTDYSINETSSYVDLAPLYGNNQEQQDKVRVKTGRGLLNPDAFAEDRLLLLPPAVCALLVLFNRNHNYVAKKLLEINERGTYTDPASLSTDDPTQKARLLTQDEEIFQTARLINCGWFGAIIFSDYFSSILGLVREGSNWSLSPFGEIRMDDHSLFERGRGNICSAEFNVLYRWHATTSAEDEKWTQQVWTKFFDGKNPQDATMQDFAKVARKIEGSKPDLTDWTFGGLQRQEDGTFNDNDLANILQNATENPAAAFRARGTPAVMRLTEIMGIEQSRRWGVCSLNDFRKFLGLKPYTSFLEWNSDPEIANIAERLYGNIDYLELYVGLQAEEAKPVVEGAGLCPGYTISRAILSDAIALTRGDRFFTHDFTPYNLTAWGFADCQRDPNAFGFGSTLGRLFLRTLPDNYKKNSVYTVFPLMLPEAMKENLTKLKVVDQYDLSRPQVIEPLLSLNSFEDVAKVLEDDTGFHSPIAERASTIIKDKGFYPVEGDKQRGAIFAALSGSPSLIEQIGHTFYETTRKLIEANSFTLVGDSKRAVNIVRDVLNLVPVYWVASDIAGIQLKTEEHPFGVYTPSQMHNMLSDIYSYIFLNTEASKVLPLKSKVKGYVRDLLDLIKGSLSTTSAGHTLSISRIIATASHRLGLITKRYNEFIDRLLELDYSIDRIANIILTLMVVSTAELSLALTNIVNKYLDAEGDDGVNVSSSSDLESFIYRTLRFDPPFQGVYRVSSKDQTVLGRHLKRGELVFLNIKEATCSHVSESADQIHLYEFGLFRNFNEHLAIKVMSEVLRAVFGFKNIRRAPGQSGILPRFRPHTDPELEFAYIDQDQNISPWPTTLTIQYDTSTTR